MPAELPICSNSKSGHCPVCDRDYCSLVYKEPEGTEGNTEQSGAILGDA